MYSEWPSIEKEVLDLDKCRSVLDTYPESVGKDVAKSVVSSLIGNGVQLNTRVPTLKTDAQVKWSMEVVCYGLSLPLSEYETIKDSVNLYLDWMTVVTNPKSGIPRPIQHKPLPYLQKMICHLENLFISRSDGSTGHQLGLCQTVLRAIQVLAHDAKILNRTTWETILMFMLKVCDTMLAPPCQPNSLSEQMCDQLMQTLLDIWLLACSRCFPTPSLWRTARDLLSSWRHHVPVVDTWARITAALTSRLLTFMYGPEFPPFKVPDEDMKFIPKSMTNEEIAQTWFRVLHLISDPVELSNTNFIAKTPKFVELTLKGDSIFDPSQHPCLRMLPYIFLKAMKGVSSLVDAFLGLANQGKYEVTYPRVLLQISTPITPTTARKSGKTKKGTVSSSAIQRPPASPGVGTTSPSPSVSSVTPPSSSLPTAPYHSLDMRPRPSPNRPQCNSVLHLFGEWLFNAALAGCKFEPLYAKEKGVPEPRSRTTSIPYSASGASLLGGSTESDGSDFPESSDAGRAEACATLCRIMSCKKSGENILPVYLSRFYLVLSQGLFGDSKQVLASILLNSVDLMRIDLPGITCLVPALITALESILPDKELQQYRPYVSVTDLRRAATHLLISMLPLALHYTTLEIEDIQELWSGPNVNVNCTTRVTFQSLRKRLLDLLIGALQCESDPINTQMILGALLLSLHDSALFEAVGNDEADGREPSSGMQSAEYDNVPVDTTYGLFVQIIHLISQKLDSWKFDLAISLAALELLSGLAQAPVVVQDRQVCSGTVHELCQYIVQQCERPPPQHKRELHSMIVSAFQTLSEWLLQHPYLLDDRECLYEVLEIIELGISGSKSKPVSTDAEPVMKADKELNPVSMRVREAAECLLAWVFEHLGAFPSPCSPSSTCSLLDERLLLRYASAGEVDDMSMFDATSNFRYFGLHNSFLLGILEHNKSNEQEPVPTVTLVLRGCTGRKVWTMQLRQTPRSDPNPPSSYLYRPERPLPAEAGEPFKQPKYRTFPEEVDKIPLVKADCSIPLLTDVPDPEQAVQIDALRQLIEAQKKYDEQITNSCVTNPETMPDCAPPRPTQEFQAARLFLSHMGFLTLDSVKAQPQARQAPDLMMLNTNDSAFGSDVESLDSLSTRNHDTVFIFYLKSGQSEMDEILSNVTDESCRVQAAFSEFLLSLGWPVDTRTHPGWCGSQQLSWKLKCSASGRSDTECVDMNMQQPSAFNGDPYILYFADALTEVAFVVPSKSVATQSDRTVGATTPGGTKEKSELSLDLQPAQSFSSVSQESPTSPTVTSGKRKISIASRTNLQNFPDTRVAVVWCESYDTFDNFSVEKLESEMDTKQETASSQNRAKDSLVVIFIYPLDCGLFRIYVHGQNGTKGGVAIPLVSGMVVSRRALGTAVRVTAMNVCRRRRLASDAFSPPHVRRKVRINELFSKYQRRCTEPEFFTSIFTDCRKQVNPVVNGGMETLKPVQTVP